MCPDWTDTVSAVSALLSAIASGTPIFLAWRIGQQQKDLQKQQLKQDLFEKRLSAYIASQDAINYSLREDGLIKLGHAEHRSFLDKKQEAEWLFGNDVREHLEGISTTVGELYTKAMARDQVIKMSGDGDGLIRETTRIEERLCTLLEKSNEVFRPYLKLTDG